MTVPESALFTIESFVEGGADHVFDTYEAGIKLGGVIYEALADILRRNICGQRLYDSAWMLGRWSKDLRSDASNNGLLRHSGWDPTHRHGMR